MIELHHVDPPRMPDKNLFTDTAFEIIAGGDEELLTLLKKLCRI